MKANTRRLIDAVHAELFDIQRAGKETQQLVRQTNDFCRKIGVNVCNTFTPYQIGKCVKPLRQGR